jgi:hypothetical protein
MGFYSFGVVLNMTFDEYVALFKEEGRQHSRELVEASGMCIYTRCAIRVHGGFELASIRVPPALQGKGLFSGFLSLHERFVPLLVENAFNPHLARHLDNRPGWHRLAEGGGIGSATFVNRNWIIAGREQRRGSEN